MQTHRGCAQRRGGFDGYDMMAHRNESRRVASSSRSDIQDMARGSRNEMEHVPVNIGERNALILFEQRLRLVRVPLRAACRADGHSLDPLSFRPPRLFARV